MPGNGKLKVRTRTDKLRTNAMIIMYWCSCLQARCPRRPGGSRWGTPPGSPPRRPWACRCWWPSCCPSWYPACYNTGCDEWWVMSVMRCGGHVHCITPNLNEYEVCSDIKKLLLRETWKEAFSDGEKTEHKNDIFYIYMYVTQSLPYFVRL